MPIVSGVGYLIVNDLLTDISYSLFEDVVDATITSSTLAGYSDGGYSDGGYGDGTGYVLGVDNTTAMYVGAEVIVGLGLPDEEVATILYVGTNSITIALVNVHAVGESIVGATFPVRQTTDPLFQQAEMLAYLSTAYSDFLTDCPLVYEIGTVTVAPTEQDATLPSDCMFPVRMANDNYPMRETSQAILDEMDYRWQLKAPSVPYAYFRDKTGLLGVGIFPRANNTTALECVYAARGPELFGLADGFSIPDPLLLYPKYRALSFAYSKDGEMRNPSLAKYWQDRYETGVRISNMFLKAITDPNLQMSEG